MKKFFRFFVNELRKNGQEILKQEFNYDGKGKKSKGYLVILEKAEIEVRGPSLGLKKEGKAFCKAKGKAVFRRKGFWWWRKNVSVEGVLKFITKFEKEMGVTIHKIDYQ